MEIIVVKILRKVSNERKVFLGTAFFINKNTLVTARHVIEYAEGDDIYLRELPEGGDLLISKDRITICEKRDVAFFKTRREFDVRTELSSEQVKIGSEVEIKGYYHLDEGVKSYKHHVSAILNAQYTCELQGHLTEGLSGSPVFIDNKIVGIAQAISQGKNITYFIPISELCMQLEFDVEADTEKESLEKIQNEIEDYIILNEFNKATQMLVGLVSKTTDNKRLRREALLHQGTARALQDEIRQYGKNSDIERQLKKLSSSLFEFLELIIDDYNRSK